MLTTGPMALKIPILPSQLARMARNKLVPHARAGKFFLFRDEDAEAIREVAIRRGYLKAEAPQPELANAAG
jgi:hypothetical protein